MNRNKKSSVPETKTKTNTYRNTNNRNQQLQNSQPKPKKKSKAEERNDEFKQVFQTFDRDGDKTISVEELKDVMEALEIEISESRIKQLVNRNIFLINPMNKYSSWSHINSLLQPFFNNYLSDNINELAYQ